MTFKEALDQGHLRLRRDPWNEYAHIEIMPAGEGHYGPWVTLRDIALPGESGEQKLLVGMQVPTDGWEPWTPPADVGRIAAQWPTYSA